MDGTQQEAPKILFLSTPSARRATIAEERAEYDRLFLSTPSARRATRPPLLSRYVRRISIHALREEGDSPSET